MRYLLAILCLVSLLVSLGTPGEVAAQPGNGDVQRFLETQSGPLKQLREDGRTAATIIESAAFYYGLSPQIHLALLETTAGLLSQTAPGDEALQYPFGRNGPPGFAAQIDWATRELRAGLGPYSRPPTLRFTDGVTLTLTLDQSPEGVAVQRFLANGRTSTEWRTAVERFGEVFAAYFDNQLVQIDPSRPPGQNLPAPTESTRYGFLLQPWPAGTRVEHLAYFDHVYPTVDAGLPGNGYVVNYLGQSGMQYDGHDGHDYHFPDQPIGSPILAAAAGIAYARTHRGNGVVILHDHGYETVYWHLDGFAQIFADLIDRNAGVPVQAGDFIGTSGRSGFVRGTPHLHFEVRRYGRQVDPYGWYGPGPDPCSAYAGCLPSVWLWHSSLIGTYHFTPPDLRSAVPQPMQANHEQHGPPATVTLNPPADLLFAATFDGHIVQEVGRGFAATTGTARFEQGRGSDQALLLNRFELDYPTEGNLNLAQGTMSLWVNVPDSYPQGTIPRHYLLATSANPGAAPVYPGTLALRRDQVGPEGEPAWIFWTTADDEASRDLLAAPDTLAPGWHHVAITWDAARGSKALYLDGTLAAATTGITLPTEVGSRLHIGRFTSGGGPSNMILDELQIFDHAMEAEAIEHMATVLPEDQTMPVVLSERTIRLDTNALSADGGIVAVQLGLNDQLEDPQPYYDAYRWTLEAEPGLHELSVRYTDRLNRTTIVTRTVLIEAENRDRIWLPLIVW